MARRIVIVGTGYTGMELARQALARGFDVVGTVRSKEGAEALRELGATPVEWDVLEDAVDALEAQLGPGCAVVYSIPTLYREYEAAGQGVARHVAPVARVLEACRRATIGRFIYLSSTSVYGDKQGEWVDEDSPRTPNSAYGKMRRDIEDFVLAQGDDFAVNVARLVGIYGPGRTLADYLAGGRYKLVDGGKKTTNRVHVADIARVLLAMIERGPEGARAYNVCDGHPRTSVELVDFLVEHVGVERPEEISLADYEKTRGPNAAARWQNSYRCGGERVRDELGVEFTYPDVLDGYRAIFGL